MRLRAAQKLKSTSPAPSANSFTRHTSGNGDFKIQGHGGRLGFPRLQFGMRYPGIIAYRLPIDPALQARYAKESSGKVRDQIQCRSGLHTYRLVYPVSLD